MGAGHHRVLRMLREEHEKERRKRIAEKHVEMFRMLEMIVFSRRDKEIINPENMIQEVISFCSLFRAINTIPEEVSPAEYYSLAYSLYDLVMTAYSRGVIDYETKKTAVNALLGHVRWAQEKFGEVKGS